MNLHLILIASNGLAAGKTTCGEEIKKKLSLCKEGTIYPMSLALKGFLVDNGFLTEYQAYDPEGKKTATNIKFTDMPCALHKIDAAASYTDKIKEVLNFIYISEVARKNLLDSLKDPDFQTRTTAQYERKLSELINKPLTARAVMQLYGTEVMRKNFLEDVWVKATAGRIAKDVIENDTKFAIIDDIRFKDEVEVPRAIIRAFDNLADPEEYIHIWVTHIYINRPNRTVTKHLSEGGIKPDDEWITLYNTGSLDDFREICGDLTGPILNIKSYIKTIERNYKDGPREIGRNIIQELQGMQYSRIGDGAPRYTTIGEQSEEEVQNQGV